jgi:GTP-binding protein
LAVRFNRVHFLLSAHRIEQLPEGGLPELAFAGRSNVGKSSLINRLVNRKGLVKTSSQPGKTRALNFFTVDERLNLVDLPGYGFARVSKSIRTSWEQLISTYLEKRQELVLVVVIVDLRHELKLLDRELIDWMRYRGLPFLVVYTKADKLKKNRKLQNAARLDAALTLGKEERIIFSAKSGEGCKALQERLALCIDEE